MLHMTVEELREKMSYTEFMGWIAYKEVEREKHDKAHHEATAKANRKSGKGTVVRK